MPKSRSLTAADYGLIALQSITWGSTFFFITIARTSFPPMTLGTIRLVAASLVLISIVYALGLRMPATAAAWKRLLIFAFLNNLVPFWLIATAQREVTGGIAAIFMATAPLSALLIAPWFVADERITARRLAGILVGIVGVVILTGAGGQAGTWRSQGMLLLSTLCYCFANIYARRTLGGHHPFAVAAAQAIGSLALSIPLAIIIDRPWTLPVPSTNAWLSAISMGVVGSGLSPLCHFTILRRAGAVNAMLSSIVVPVTPVFLGWLYLGEHLSAAELLGGLTIGAALTIIDGRIWARLRWRQNS